MMICSYICFMSSLLFLFLVMIVFGEVDSIRSNYNVLGIPEGTADIAVIKKAYRALAIKVCLYRL